MTTTYHSHLPVAHALCSLIRIVVCYSLVSDPALGRFSPLRSNDLGWYRRH